MKKNIILARFNGGEGSITFVKDELYKLIISEERGCIIARLLSPERDMPPVQYQSLLTFLRYWREISLVKEIDRTDYELLTETFDIMGITYQTKHDNRGSYVFPTSSDKLLDFHSPEHNLHFGFNKDTGDLIHYPKSKQ